MHILLVNNVWASRRGHNLRVRNGTPEQIKRTKLLKSRDALNEAFTTPGAHWRTKEKRVDQLHTQLGLSPVLPAPLRELEDVIADAAYNRERRLRNSTRSSHPTEMTLAPAISNGCSAVQSVELGNYLTRTQRNSVASFIDQVIATKRDIAPQDNHLCLDLNTLRSANLIKTNSMTHWILDLLDLTPPADRALISINLKGENSVLHLTFMDPIGMIIQSQAIDIATRSNMPGRSFLVCPVSKKLHQRLYFRDGFFASSIVQRLKTRSQLGPGSLV